MAFGLSDPTVEALARGLGLAARRHAVLAENVANLATPGYRARDVAFDDVLRPLLEAAPPGMRPRLLEAGAALSPRPRLVLAGDGPPRSDGNDVDLDRQMARLAENALFHHALTQLLAARFALLRQAISGRV